MLSIRRTYSNQVCKFVFYCCYPFCKLNIFILTESTLISTTEEETPKLERVSSSTAEALSRKSSADYEYPEIIKAQIHKTEEEPIMQDISLEELGKSIIIHSVLPGEDDYILPISTDATTDPVSQTVVDEELHSKNTLKEDDTTLNSDQSKETEKTKEIPLTPETIDAPVIKEPITKDNMVALNSPRELSSSPNASEENDKEINEDEDQPTVASNKTLSPSSNKINERSPQHLKNETETESAPLVDQLDSKSSVPDEKSKTDMVEESEDEKINKDVTNESTDKTLSPITHEDSSISSSANEQIAMSLNTNLADGSDVTNVNKEDQDRILHSKEVVNVEDCTEKPSLNQSENQESNSLLDEDVQTLEKENHEKNINIKKRYINEETGEYTHSPEEVSKSETLKNKEKDSIETEIITTLFKTEEEKLLATTNDKASKDKNDDIKNADNIEITNKTSQDSVDPLKSEEERRESSDKTGNIQLKTNLKIYSFLFSEESLNKPDEENSKVENDKNVRCKFCSSINKSLNFSPKYLSYHSQHYQPQMMNLNWIRQLMK